MNAGLRILIILLLIALQCDRNPLNRGSSAIVASGQRFDITSTPTKWYNNHSAAVSLTFDIPVPVCNTVVSEALRRSIQPDVEMVTSLEFYKLKDKAVFRDLESFSAQGIHFFGHGHLHDSINYDSVSYEVALAQFDSCFRFMEEWNLSPLAYGYPGGHGEKVSTQKAVADAGFICARGIQPDTDSNFICADDQAEPEKWFYLPAVCVGNVSGFSIHDHTGMVELFEKNLLKKSWLIPMYHSIGDLNGWGYYPMDDYIEDLEYLLETDTWLAHMDVVARYIMERNSYRMSWRMVDEATDMISIEAVFSDSLDPELERVPLTLEMEVSGDTPFSRCDVTDNTGVLTSHPIRDNRFTMNITPGGEPILLNFYLPENE